MWCHHFSSQPRFHRKLLGIVTTKLNRQRIVAMPKTV